MGADKARDRKTGEIVALKKVRFDRSRDGVPVTSIRELRVLQVRRLCSSCLCQLWSRVPALPCACAWARASTLQPMPQSCQHQNIVQLKRVVTGRKPDRWGSSMWGMTGERSHHAQQP